MSEWKRISDDEFEELFEKQYGELDQRARSSSGIV